MRRLFTLSLVMALIAAACGGSSETASGSSDGTSPEGGPTENALEFTAASVNGPEIEGTSLGGGPLILWFWAPW